MMDRGAVTQNCNGKRDGGVVLVMEGGCRGGDHRRTCEQTAECFFPAAAGPSLAPCVAPPARPATSPHSRPAPALRLARWPRRAPPRPPHSAGHHWWRMVLLPPSLLVAVTVGCDWITCHSARHSCHSRSRLRTRQGPHVSRLYFRAETSFGAKLDKSGRVWKTRPDNASCSSTSYREAGQLTRSALPSGQMKEGQPRRRRETMLSAAGWQ